MAATDKYSMSDKQRQLIRDATRRMRSKPKDSGKPPVTAVPPSSTSPYSPEEDDQGLFMQTSSPTDTDDDTTSSSASSTSPYSPEEDDQGLFMQTSSPTDTDDDTTSGSASSTSPYSAEEDDQGLFMQTSSPTDTDDDTTSSSASSTSPYSAEEDDQGLFMQTSSPTDTDDDTTSSSASSTSPYSAEEDDQGLFMQTSSPTDTDDDAAGDPPATDDDVRALIADVYHDTPGDPDGDGWTPGETQDVRAGHVARLLAIANDEDADPQARDRARQWLANSGHFIGDYGDTVTRQYGDLNDAFAAASASAKGGDVEQVERHVDRIEDLAIAATLAENDGDSVRAGIESFRTWLESEREYRRELPYVLEAIEWAKTSAESAASIASSLSQPDFDSYVTDADLPDALNTLNQRLDAVNDLLDKTPLRDHAQLDALNEYLGKLNTAVDKLNLQRQAEYEAQLVESEMLAQQEGGPAAEPFARTLERRDAIESLGLEDQVPDLGRNPALLDKQRERYQVFLDAGGPDAVAAIEKSLADSQNAVARGDTEAALLALNTLDSVDAATLLSSHQAERLLAHRADVARWAERRDAWRVEADTIQAEGTVLGQAVSPEQAQHYRDVQADNEIGKAMLRDGEGKVAVSPYANPKLLAAIAEYNRLARLGLLYGSDPLASDYSTEVGETIWRPTRVDLGPLAADVTAEWGIAEMVPPNPTPEQMKLLAELEAAYSPRSGRNLWEFFSDNSPAGIWRGLGESTEEYRDFETRIRAADSNIWVNPADKEAWLSYGSTLLEAPGAVMSIPSHWLEALSNWGLDPYDPHAPTKPEQYATWRAEGDPRGYEDPRLDNPWPWVGLPPDVTEEQISRLQEERRSSNLIDQFLASGPLLSLADYAYRLGDRPTQNFYEYLRDTGVPRHERAAWAGEVLQELVGEVPIPTFKGAKLLRIIRDTFEKTEDADDMIATGRNVEEFTGDLTSGDPHAATVVAAGAGGASALGVASRFARRILPFPFTHSPPYHQTALQPNLAPPYTASTYAVPTIMPASPGTPPTIIMPSGQKIQLTSSNAARSGPPSSSPPPVATITPNVEAPSVGNLALALSPPVITMPTPVADALPELGATVAPSSPGRIGQLPTVMLPSTEETSSAAGAFQTEALAQAMNSLKNATVAPPIVTPALASPIVAHPIAPPMVTPAAAPPVLAPAAAPPVVAPAAAPPVVAPAVVPPVVAPAAAPPVVEPAAAPPVVAPGIAPLTATPGTALPIVAPNISPVVVSPITKPHTAPAVVAQIQTQLSAFLQAQRQSQALRGKRQQTTRVKAPIADEEGPDAGRAPGRPGRGIPMHPAEVEFTRGGRRVVHDLSTGEERDVGPALGMEAMEMPIDSVDVTSHSPNQPRDSIVDLPGATDLLVRAGKTHSLRRSPKGRKRIRDRRL